jgi:hypothetical protein
MEEPFAGLPTSLLRSSKIATRTCPYVSIANPVGASMAAG